MACHRPTDLENVAVSRYIPGPRFWSLPDLSPSERIGLARTNAMVPLPDSLDYPPIVLD
jgi:hypothetical protein